MKALKISAIALALILTFSGCGNKQNNNAPDSDTSVSIDSTEHAIETSSEKKNSEVLGTEKKSENNTASKKEDSKEDASNKEDSEHTMYYWCMEAEKDNLNITYHKKDCPLIKDEKPTEVGKEVIKMIGLNRCEKCNPPEFK